MVALAVMATACRVDVSVDVAMEEDGSGIITVAAMADAELVSRAPSIATDLRFDDMQAAGWTVEGPIPTQADGIQVRLTHEFSTPAQANALLAQISGTDGPFADLIVSRRVVERTTTYSITGHLGPVVGLEAFSDADLTAALGAVPYADQLASSKVEPGEVIGIIVTASLPGKIDDTTTASELRWAVPFDGSTVQVATTSKVVEPENTWIRPLASGLKIALFAWIMLSLVGFAYVFLLRRNQRIENQPWY
ncbi:MAG TPA: hypothetical protein PLV68_14310 [Ilumatobacteraceae bacterium]|nr:hypothetical protein [Ilumatobacteraceae bacterium]